MPLNHPQTIPPSPPVSWLCECCLPIAQEGVPLWGNALAGGNCFGAEKPERFPCPPTRIPSEGGSPEIFSCVRLFVTLWTTAHQAPLSMGFYRQEHWSGLPCPPPGDLPDPGIKLAFPTSAGVFFITGPQGMPQSPPSPSEKPDSLPLFTWPSLAITTQAPVQPAAKTTSIPHFTHFILFPHFFTGFFRWELSFF